MGEVEPETVRSHIAAGLVHMAAQHLFQGRMEQMGGRMVPGNVRPRFRFTSNSTSSPTLRVPCSRFPAGWCSRPAVFGVGHVEDALVGYQPAGIPQLTAPFCMEGGVGEDHGQFIPTLGVLDGLGVVGRENGRHFPVFAGFVHSQAPSFR